MANATVEYVEFTQEQADQWDRMQALKVKASNGEKANKEARAIKDEIVKAFGDAPLAVLPDGRKLAKTHKTQHRKAQKAHDVEWWEVSEA